MIFQISQNVTSPAFDGGAEALHAENGVRRRMWVRALAVSVLCAGLQFGLGVIAAPAQTTDTDMPSQNTEPPITPAVNPTYPDFTVPEPIFPQSPSPGERTTSRSSARSTLSTGPGLGAGLGYGPIRAGDIVEVQVFDSPEYSISMPVSPAGEIALPYVGIFHIGGMTSIQAAGAIGRLLEDRQLLRDAHVIVTTEQFGYNVTVLGEVRSPGIYPLVGKKRLLDVLTLAGGLTDRAGHLIEIFNSETTKNPRTVLWDPTLRENDNADLQLSQGQTVLVSRCGVVYVGGGVMRPGAYPLCDSNHTTLSEVIALAMGTRPSVWSQRTLLLRTSGSGTRVVAKIRLQDVLQGKKMDITMQPDDIVYIPPSSVKAAGKVLASAAIGFATQAYFYLH